MDIGIGEYLRMVRGKMSLREAATKSGLSHSFIHNLERGTHPINGRRLKPRPESLQKLAQAYNHPYNDLMQKAGFLRTDNPEVDFLDNVNLEISDAQLLNKFKLHLDGRELTQLETEQFISFLRAVRYQNVRS